MNCGKSMPPRCKSIPTIGPRGLRFRSRLEAKLAFVFDKLGLNWHFEPIDMDGYIPDFLIDNGDGSTLLVEVKGTIIFEDLQHYVKKIFESGWKEDFVIIGACAWKEELNQTEKACIGIYGSCLSDDQTTDKAFINRSDNRVSISTSLESNAMSYYDFESIFSDAQNRTQWKKKRTYKKRKTTINPKNFKNMFNLP